MFEFLARFDGCWHPCRGAWVLSFCSGGIARASLDHRLQAFIPPGWEAEALLASYQPVCLVSILANMSEGKFIYDVFLSHSSKDKAIVRDIAERLRKDGLKVWFDKWSIKPGNSIPSKVEEGLEPFHFPAAGRRVVK